MRNKKIWLSILTPCTILIPIVSAISATSCSIKVVKIREVDNFQDFTVALLDKTIDIIRLTNNIGIPMTTDLTASEVVLIGRSVTIDGNGGKKILCYDDRNNPSPQLALFRVKTPYYNDEQSMIVTFKDIDIELKSKSLCSSVVCVDNAPNAVVNFENAKLTSTDEITTGFYSHFALSISPELRDGCAINITNSNFNGWGAIYNMGSNVKLFAKDSTFIGKNYKIEKKPKEEYDFATITLSDYPIDEKPKYDGWCENHSFSANNNFTFANCDIKAQTTSTTTFDDSHQFIVQSRCPAHNIVNIDTSTATLSNGINSGDDSAWYAFAWREEADVTDGAITKYRTSSNHVDMPNSIHNANDYYTYYGKEEQKSYIWLEGQPVQKTTGHIHYYWINSDLKWVEPNTI